MNSTTASSTSDVQLEDEAQDQTPQVPDGFCVRDAETATWVVRKVVEARAYADRVRAWAAAELRRAEREEGFFLYRYGQQLEQWARRQLEAENGRRKSINLPSGTIGFRQQPERLEVTDDDALLRWCKAHLPSAVATVQCVLRNVVKERVRHSGELPEGAELAGGGKRFFVK